MKHALLSLSMVTLLLGCDSAAIHEFEGTWINQTTEANVVVVQRSGSDYFILVNGTKLPATLSGSQLVVDNQSTLAIDEASGTMVFQGEDYVRMDGSQFLGKWAYNNGYELMEVSKTDTGFSILWKSRTDNYQPHEIKSVLVDGALVGDYYGHNGNFRLEVSGPKAVSLHIDPFAEFQPIRNQQFYPTASVFVVSGGDEFVGFWRDNWDIGSGEQGEISLNITRAGSLYNVRLLLRPHGRWDWSAAFRNGELVARHAVEQDRPVLKLVSPDSIMLTDFYMMGSNEHGLLLVSRTPSP
jgi:hypothetical protein